VLVEGEGGIGKTRLLAEFLSGAARSRVVAVRGQAQEIERDRPFGVLTDALQLDAPSQEPSRARLGHLLAGKAPPPGQLLVGAFWEAAGLRSLIADGIVSVIEQQTSSGLAILVLEDIDWADDSTLLVLHRLARRIKSLRLMLVCSCQLAPRRREVAAVRAEFAAVGGLILELSPLDQEAALVLAAKILMAQPDSSLVRHLERAGGNPLFLTELILSLDRENRLLRHDGFVGVQSEIPPRSLRALIVDRLAYLPDRAWELMRVASVFGPSFTPAGLASVTGRTGYEIVAALEEPIRTGVVVEAGDGLAFRHALVRDAIYYDMPSALRTELHSDIAQELDRSGAPLPQVARHISFGALPGDSGAVKRLREAAASAHTDPSAAVGYLHRAVEIAGEDYPDRDGLLADLIITLVGSGKLTEAESVARDALSHVRDASSQVKTRLALSQALMLQNRLGDSIGELEVAAELARGDERERLQILADISYRRVLAGELDRGAAEAQSVIDASERAGAELATTVARLALSHHMFYQGYLREAVELARPALEAARGLGSEEVASTIDADLGIFLMHADQGEEAEIVPPSQEDSHPGRASWQLPRDHYTAGYRSFYSGQWDTAIREFQTGLNLADDLHMRWWSPAVRSSLATIFIHRDELAAAEAVLGPTEPDLQVSYPDCAADYVLASRALLAEARGETDAAVELISAAARLVRSWGLWIRYRRIGPDLVRLLASHGEGRQAMAAVEALEAVAGRAHVASLEGTALLCRGMVEADADLLLAAVAAYRRGNRPVELALACEEAAAALAARGDRPEARPLFEEALDVYARIGARRDRARARSRMRQLGVRLGPRQRHRPAGQGWDSLTSAEQEVVRLVVEGLTNRQIAARLYLSPRTVETHLGLIFSKLGLQGRLGLALEGARRGLVETPTFGSHPS
jgi:DNA-binding CsgD family transcriptional regulator